ncbi:MAG: type VI secretion system tip protein TssI/VgrG [Myxococcota bacterium]
MASSFALPHVQYNASLVAPAWGPHADTLELEGTFLRVRDLDLREELGEPWQLSVEVTSAHPDFDPSRLVGAEFSLHMLREDAANPAENDGRFFHGVVERSAYVGAFADAYHARLYVVPALALLRNTSRSRVFQDRSVVEIFEEVAGPVLEPRGREVDVQQLAREYPMRDYCVQYRETDLAFVQRILAEEGIVLAFEADEVLERTVLLDDRDRFRSVLRTVEGLEGNPPPQHMPVRGDRGELSDEETIAAFTWRRSVHAPRTEVEQWDWKQAAPAQLQARIVPEGGDAPWHAGEHYRHGARRLQEGEGGDGQHLDDSMDRAERAATRLVLDANVFEGLSNALSMTPGGTFELDGHPDPELNGPYYCLRVAHHADNAHVELGGGGGSPYGNRFICTALDNEYAPHVRARPRIYGVQTATVVGPAGEEIHTDAYGRVKVRLHWDREQRDQDDDTSCWLRVAQSWAGGGWGAQFVPRIGMEVLVSFLGGDPDRPVCVGAVYNGQNMPPYSLPDSKTQSGIKTRSSPGGDGYNELRFDDAAGSEEVYFHAQKDHNERVLNAHAQRVGATQTVSVGANQSLSVGGARSVSVTGDQTIKVGAEPPEDGEPKPSPSHHSLSTTGSITQTADQTVLIEATEKITLKCGASSIVIDPASITITAGSGASIAVASGLGLMTGGPGGAAAPGIDVSMDKDGKMGVASILGSTVSIDGEIHATSAAQSFLSLTDTVKAMSPGRANVELSTDVAIQGANIKQQAAGASLELSTGIKGSGASVAMSAGPSKLELGPASAKLASVTVDVTGMGMVNIGAPNVKIN